MRAAEFSREAGTVVRAFSAGKPVTLSLTGVLIESVECVDTLAVFTVLVPGVEKPIVIPFKSPAWALVDSEAGQSAPPLAGSHCLAGQ